MAIPPNAKAIAQPLDPADILDLETTITQGPPDAVPAPLILNTENVASFTLTLSAEAVAAGLQIKTGDGYPAPTLSDLKVTFWLAVDPAMQGSPLFNAPGLTLALELTLNTTSVPSRRKQRTITVTVANQ